MKLHILVFTLFFATYSVCVANSNGQEQSKTKEELEKEVKKLQKKIKILKKNNIISDEIREVRNILSHTNLNMSQIFTSLDKLNTNFAIARSENTTTWENIKKQKYYIGAGVLIGFTLASTGLCYFLLDQKNQR